MCSKGYWRRAKRRLEEPSISYKTNYVADVRVRQLFFRDPDGNQIEIGTDPPAQELTEARVSATPVQTGLHAMADGNSAR